MACTGLFAMAQQTLPNGNFESWTQESYQNPKYYGSSNDETKRADLPPSCIRATSAYHGTSAIRITTVAAGNGQIPGFFVNSNPDGDPNTWHGGIPLNGTPTGVRGYYQSAVQPGDTGYVIVAFSKNGVNIGSYFFQLYGTHTSYTPFQFEFEPALSEAPDSIIFGVVSSDIMSENFIEGSMLQLDSISLTGIANQPTQLNGDFEEWETVTSHVLSGWYVDMDDYSLVRSTDAYKGTYATRIETELGDRDGVPQANARTLSTGYYPRNCNQCHIEGGYPFTNLSDTLLFWYKYTPSNGSVAQVMVQVKQNGQIIGGNMQELAPASEYTAIEFPIQVFGSPDTLVVTFQSSRWEDSLVTQAGAVLLVDEVQLQSERLHTGLFAPKAVKQAVGVYPNPATNTVVFKGDALIGAQYHILSITGQVVLSGKIQTLGQQIDIGTLEGGLYFYTLQHDGQLLSTGKFRVE